MCGVYTRYVANVCIVNVGATVSVVYGYQLSSEEEQSGCHLEVL